MAMALLLLGLLLVKLIHSVGLSHLVQCAIVCKADFRLISRMVRSCRIVDSTLIAGLLVLVLRSHAFHAVR